MLTPQRISNHFDKDAVICQWFDNKSVVLAIQTWEGLISWIKKQQRIDWIENHLEGGIISRLFIDLMDMACVNAHIVTTLIDPKAMSLMDFTILSR